MMNFTTDAYWDELGIAWRAFNPDLSALEQRLRLRLRTQALCANVLAFLGIPLSVAIAALGAFTVWIGFSTGAWNFVTRGIALIAIAALLAFAGWSQRTGGRGETSTLSQMLALALLRAERLRKAAVLGIAICAVAAVFGLVGYAIRIRIGHAPAMSPLEPLALLALATLALILYARRAADDLRRLRYLKRALVPEQAP
jgi:hypothetical protein